MLYIRESVQPIETVCDQLRYAAGIHGMHLVAVHDLKRRLNARGVEFQRECQVFELCNAERARDALDYHMAVAAILPTRIAVYEEHGRVKAAAMKPSFQLSLFGSGALRSLAAEVDRSLVAIIDDACRTPVTELESTESLSSTN